jgi:Tfp pilus assembly protein PilF
MSLLLKALQNAAKNREAAGAGAPPTEADASDNSPPPARELSLEPVQAEPHGAARMQSFSTDEIGERKPASSPQQAQTVMRANVRREPPASREPGFLAWLGRRPLLAFSTAAGLFAVSYGVYLYLQITDPGMFVARPSAPPPPSTLTAAANLPAAPAPAAEPVPSAPAPAPRFAPPPTVLEQPAAPPAAAAAVGPGTATPSGGAATGTPRSPDAAATAAAPGASTPLVGSPAVPPAPRGSAPPAPPISPRALEPRESAATARSAPPPAAAAAPGAAVDRSPRPRMRPAAPAAPAANVPESAGIASAPTIQTVAVDSSVVAGYQALEKGQPAEAERMYRQALTNDARNVDAMLGLAAALSQQQRGDAASQLYLRVLEIDPRNAHAQAGLLNLAGRADPAAAEARLKQLIARDPTAFLYFSLGNLYAEQGQWAAAQSAYFQAHTLAPDNPDYAFNLAVGLEHLSQTRIALDYYRRAIALAQARGHAQFELARVENRVRSLESTLAQRP